MSTLDPHRRWLVVEAWMTAMLDPNTAPYDDSLEREFDALCLAISSRKHLRQLGEARFDEL